MHPAKWVRAFLQELKVINKVKLWKRRKPKTSFSTFDWLTSSFASMEVSTQLKQVFKLIDSNGDGKISAFELKELLLCLGHDKATATDEAERMVRQVDRNGNGHIDLDEFMGVVNKNDDLMDVFLIFDNDRNGLISAKELQQVLIRLGFANSRLQDCRSMIEGVDKDGDGFVNFEEFRSMMTDAPNFCGQ